MFENRKVFPVRKIASLVVLVALAATLTACSTQNGTVAGCATTQPGSVSNSIKVSGKFGKTPTVKVGAPIKKVTTTQRTVITAGTGAVASKNKKVTADFVIYNGTTGKELTSTKWDGQPVPFTMDTSKFLPGLVKTLQCSRVGTRVVGIIPPKDAFGSTGSSSLGVGAKDDMVVVADVDKVTAGSPPALKKATGTTEAPKPGFPGVTFTLSLIHI